ncbi:MAG: cardiolipin synthase [Candidatus Saccharimonadales bacterium]
MPEFLNIAGPVGAAWLVLDWTLRIVALFVVPRGRKPTAGMAWLLFIFFFPLLGFLIFLVLGSPKLPAHRRTAQKTLDKALQKVLANLKRHDSKKLLSAEAPAEYKSLAKLSQSLTGLPVFGGNNIEILPEYDDVAPRMVKDIDAANVYVHVEFFIIAIDAYTQPVFDALARAVKRGVTVRLLYDAFATHRYPKWKEMIKQLEASGVHVQAMLPFRMPGKGYTRPDLRNHRKLLIVDGHVGYTGSLNLIRRDYHRKDDIYYDELVARVDGPVALQMSAVFLTDWHAETGEILEYRDTKSISKLVTARGTSLAQILPSGPGYEDENNLKLFTSLMHQAQDTITIVNPYFVPDDALTNAITSAARRGVTVTLINSEAMDQWMVGHAQRSFYDVFLAAGVRVYLYNAPVLLHSKFMVIDGRISTIGSSNLDIRSFTLNMEVTLTCYDPAVARKLQAVADDCLTRSHALHLHEWRKRPRRQQLGENLARLTSALQ